MKWLGQHIVSLIARFRNSVYFENVENGTTDTDKFLVIGSSGKLKYRTGAEVASDIGASGDITSVGITTDSGAGSPALVSSGAADFRLLGSNGVGITNSGVTITAQSVPGEIDHDSLLNWEENKHFTQAGITTVGTIGTGVWQGTAIAHAYIGNDAIDGDNIADDAVDSEHYTDGSIDTAHIADDAVTFAKAVGVTPNVFGSYIKLIPSDFMANDDGGNTRLGIGYVDTAGEADYGMRVSHSDTELFAFVSIPEGMKATHVEVFGRRAKAVEVFEVQINASTLVSKGTGTCGIPSDTIGDQEINITDVTSTATNLLAIEVTVTSNSADKVYGGRVKIAAV